MVRTFSAVGIALAVLMFGALYGLVAVPLENRDTATRHLVGKEASDYITQRASREPVFAEFLRKTETELSAKGWSRLTSADAVVLRTAKTPQPTRLQKALGYLFGPALAAQDASTSNGDGEMVWAGWHDGDWNNWEGGIWVRDYVIGDTWSFNMQFDYHNSTDGITPVFETWMGAVDWRDREGRTRQGSLNVPKGFLAKLAGAFCATVEAQASDGLSCTAGARATTSAFMRQAFGRLAENAGWAMGSAAGAGVTSGSAAFFPTLGAAAWGILLDGYLAEFRRFYNRCSGGGF